MAEKRHPSPVLVRSVAALVVAVAAGVPAGMLLGVVAGLLSGWAAFAATHVAWVLLVVWEMDADATRAHATSEDPGRRLTGLVALVGSLASLGAVLVVLLQTRGAGRAADFALAGIAVVSVVASWALIQVDYMLRTARLYYAEPVGGIDFNQDEAPMYTDFAYFSVGLGMTYQVADTNVRTNEMRRLVIAQTLLAYLFGAGILATVINLVTGLG